MLRKNNNIYITLRKHRNEKSAYNKFISENILNKNQKIF